MSGGDVLLLCWRLSAVQRCFVVMPGMVCLRLLLAQCFGRLPVFP